MNYNIKNKHTVSDLKELNKSRYTHLSDHYGDQFGAEVKSTPCTTSYSAQREGEPATDSQRSIYYLTACLAVLTLLHNLLNLQNIQEGARWVRKAWVSPLHCIGSTTTQKRS